MFLKFDIVIDLKKKWYVYWFVEYTFVVVLYV